jgi:hypothetical protein
MVIAVMTASACATPEHRAESAHPMLAPSQMPQRWLASDPAADERVLALDPEHITAQQVREVLSLAPAPRIIALQGSVDFVTMQPFSEFLIAMGYPADRLRNPASGSLSYSSYTDSARLAGTLAWYREHEGMTPMLIGHSQGGMIVVRVLHELAAAFSPSIEVWNPVADRGEGRDWFVDPDDGARRSVVGLRVDFAAALATGKLPRLLLGQWTMLGKLRAIPDSAIDFTGYTIDWDPIAGTFPGGEPYHALGSAHVRNIDLPATTSHIGLPDMRSLAADPAARALIDTYRPPPEFSVADAAGTGDAGRLIVAADLWYSVKKHWCLDAQRAIHARRALAARARR